MAQPPRPKAQIDFDLASTIAHHDAEIVNLGGRMTGVEQGMKSLESTVQNGFGQISNTLAEMRGKAGPGLGDLLKVIATGGVIVGMSAAAITMLVNSFISPQLTELKDATVLLTKDREARVSREDEELSKLREARKEKIEKELGSLVKKIEEIEDRVGWSPAVKPAGGKGF